MLIYYWLLQILHKSLQNYHYNIFFGLQILYKLVNKHNLCINLYAIVKDVLRCYLFGLLKSESEWIQSLEVLIFICLVKRA